MTADVDPAHPVTGRVVVGVDGSAASADAVRFAAAHARRHRAGLTLVHAVPDAPPSREPLVAEATRALAQMAAALRIEYPTVDIDHAIRNGGPVPVIVGYSATADLVVVGCRGITGFEELMLGSVSAQVAAYAAGPVVVVRQRDQDPVAADAPVIVGVDGSQANRPAVEYAFAEARARRRRLVALRCWAPDAQLMHGYTVADLASDETQAMAALMTTLAPLRQAYPDVTVEERSIRHGFPETILVEASAEAELMVVGSRGRGEVAGLLLGSVSQALLHRGHGPIAVVKHGLPPV